MKFKHEQHFDFLLPFIVMLSAFLNAFGIWWDQYSNTYYTAAVTSMLQSWHTFFFASLDPAGYITIDKPPVVFWIQTLFAHIFGVHGWSVILPQALAGVGSVLLIYYLVKPAFGKTAARLSSLVMACTPIAVAVSRTNNIDSMLVFTLLLAAWMLFQGINTRKAFLVVGAFALIGVGFNMKMFQAYMVAPAFYLFYLLAFRGDWGKKLAILAAATVALIVVTISWATIVDAIPPANRPYIGGSGTNSVWELALGYNGIQRLEGMGGHGGGPGGGPGGGNAPNRQQGQGSGQYFAANEKVTTKGNNLVKDATTATLQSKNSAVYGNADTGQTPGSANDSRSRMSSFSGGGPGPQGLGVGGGTPQGQAPPSGGSSQHPGGGGSGPQGAGPGVGGGGVFDTGYQGPLRLFQSELSDQISWMLPFVGFACLALLAGSRRRKRSKASPPGGANGGRLWCFKSISDRIRLMWSIKGAGQLSSDLANMEGAENGTVLQTKRTPAPELLITKQKETLFWLSWLLPGMAFFSVAGFYHQYYLIMLAPPIAVLTGAGWSELWNRYRCRDGWQMWLLPSALLAATAFQLYILKPYWKQIGGGWSIGIGVGGIAIALALTLILVIERIRPVSTRLVSGLAMAGMLVLLVAPLYWSTTPLLYGVNSVMPAAGPGGRITFGRGSGGGGGRGSATDDALIKYTTPNNTGESCLFATTDTGTAETYILYGKSVIALGGFNGGDNTLTKLEQMVKDKKIKFFLIPSGSGFGGSGDASDVVSWIRAHGTEVPVKDWQSGALQGGVMVMGNAETLYEIQE